MKDFWAWATVHYWMTFFIVLSISKTVRTVFKSVCRIWWPPAPVTVDLSGQSQQPQRAETTLLGLEQMAPTTVRPRSQAAVVVNRRNVWRRLLDED